MYGEDKFVIMFGGLHIEMASLRTLGDWLLGSRWVETLVQAEVTTAGNADSLDAAHVARTRFAHQVTAAALYILQYRAYNNKTQIQKMSLLGLLNGAQRRMRAAHKSNYWATVMFYLLVFVRSQRQSSFKLCSLLWTTPAMSAGSQFISVTLLSYHRNTQMLPDIMLAISRFRRQSGSSRQSPSIKHMNIIMLASRVMEGR